MIETDVIGVLYRDPIDPSDPDEVRVPYPGWRVNITVQGLAERPDLAAYVVTPARLRRVWAGDAPTDPDVTVALSFASEVEALAVLAAPDA